MISPWIQTDHHRVYVRLGTSPFALVTFSSLGFDPEVSDYWASPVVKKLDMTCVGVVARKANWFPRAEIEALAPRIRAVLSDFPEVLGYGASMGGYGVLRHGKLLGCTTTIAFSPQISIDPELAEFDPRYRPHFDPDLNTGDAISELPPRNFVVFDPYQPLDREHVERIKRLGPITEIHAPFLDHDTVRMMQSSTVANALFRHVLANNAQGVRGLLRPLRRTLPIYYRSIAYRGLAIRRSETWTKIGVTRGLERFPTDPVLLDYRARSVA
jgi:hypothetical protein